MQMQLQPRQHVLRMPCDITSKSSLSKQQRPSTYGSKAPPTTPSHVPQQVIAPSRRHLIRCVSIYLNWQFEDMIVPTASE